MWFNYNVIFVPAAVLGYDKATADFDAVAALIRDKYLLPQLRDRRGASSIAQVSGMFEEIMDSFGI